MPRSANGTFGLVSGNPVISGTIIESEWANTTLPDIAAGLSDSLSRIGKGGMQAALKLTDGSDVAPSLTFTNDVFTGRFLFAQNDMRDTVGGVEIAKYTPTSLEVWVEDLAQWVDVYQIAAMVPYDDSGATIVADNVQDAIDAILTEDFIRSITVTTGITNTGTAVDPILGFDQTWGGQTYLGLNAQAADSAKLGGVTAASYALLNDPVFTGNPRAPTPAPGDSDTTIATTAFVQSQSSALVQSGSNANGYYRIYADGYIEQWIWNKNSSPTWITTTFPVAFASSDTVFIVGTQQYFDTATSAFTLRKTNDTDQDEYITNTTFQFTNGAAIGNFIYCTGY